MPVGEVLPLEAIEPLKAPYFLTRREMGIFNVGGPGVVRAGNAVFEMDYKEALYLGSGDREVTFESKDAAHPAKFYFNSVTAHRNYPDKKETILMPGGTFRKKSASFHGQLAENAFEHFSFDKLFMGTDGIDLNAGVTTFNEVYTVSKAMCNAAREVILMADSSKFGRKSPNVVCSLESVDKLITDAGIDPAFRQALEEKGIDVIITGESNE